VPINRKSWHKVGLSLTFVPVSPEIAVLPPESLLLALGANRCGPWGTPEATLGRACRELVHAGLRIVRSSRIYVTPPLGPGGQAPYLNAVLLLEAHMAPAALMRLVKRIERRAGRRSGPLWGPRTLDIDLLDFAGRRLGWPIRRRERGRLTLPHPEMHRRAFVLVPLLEVAPHWRHPALGLTGRALLERVDARAKRGILPTLDFVSSTCDKKAT
jgi:2-amino-4-hydroxy-6-hydroxymethyldihydropteridine diphosphokinase